MVDFCPDCDNLLRRNVCKCGYNKPNIKSVKSRNFSNTSLIHIWNPPTPNIIYCKISATSLDTLRKMVSKGKYPVKLKEIKKKLKNHLFSYTNCLYYNEELFHCQIKNKYIDKESICSSYEPFEKA